MADIPLISIIISGLAIIIAIVAVILSFSIRGPIGPPGPTFSIFDIQQGITTGASQRMVASPNKLYIAGQSGPNFTLIVEPGPNPVPGQVFYISNPTGADLTIQQTNNPLMIDYQGFSNVISTLQMATFVYIAPNRASRLS